MASSTHATADVRRLWPADMPLFRDHLLRLDSRSRHERFAGGMSDDFLVRYAQDCFGEGDLVFGAFVDGVMRGAAELRSSEAIWSEQAPFQRHIHAEAAFSVEEPYRRIEQAASNHGVETIEIVCAPDNVGMMRLAGKFKTQFSFEENQFTGRLNARLPTAFSLLREASRDVMDMTASVFDARTRDADLGAA